MPVRDKAVRHMVSEVATGSMPKVVALALYHAADALYTKTMDSIDWKRVMHDAATRHMALHDGEYLTSGLGEEHQAGEVCSECIHEALLANEWGGTSLDRTWERHERSLHATLNFRQPASSEEVRALVSWIATHLGSPDTAPEDQLEPDGHLQVCEEIGRPPDGRILCHPACPNYDGWIEELVS